MLRDRFHNVNAEPHANGDALHTASRYLETKCLRPFCTQLIQQSRVSYRRAQRPAARIAEVLL